MFVESAFARAGLTIERLRAFCKIAEAGSIVLAANGDPTRQSQFSRQVKELEDALGTKLVERAGKSIRLTDDGRKLALLAQSFFHSIEEMRTAAERRVALRIGAAESVLRWLLVPKIQDLRRLSPGVRFEFQTQRTAQLVEGVMTGRLDMIIIREDAADDSLKILPCGSMNYVFVVPRALVPGRTAAGFQLLPTIPFAMLSGDGILTKNILNLAKKTGVNLDVQIEAENISLLIAAIKNADFAAIIPAPALADLSKEQFTVVEIDDMKMLTRELVLAYSPEAAQLRESIRGLAPRISALIQRAR